MQITAYFRENRVHIRNCLFLLLLCMVAYWPLSLGIFSVKNDAVHYFLPYRFHISEALRNGEWPFWSPYIYNGNPIMGDMQSGAWNPVVWLFSLFGRYDITLFHWENLLYILLGGVGMYKLVNRLTANSSTAFLLGASYMVSGFMLGGQLINWLAAAAFLPFVLHYYLLTLKSNSYIPAVKTGIALYLLFTAGYPSFFILTGYLLVMLFVVHIITVFREKGSVRSLLHCFLPQLLVIFVFVCLSLPAILSYIHLLPYYDRGTGTTYAAAASNAFDARYFITLLLPPAIKSNDIIAATDITCRNIYFGLIPLLVLIALPPKMNRRNSLLLCLALFSILFSMGDATPVREWCYRFIPLLDTFRHPSQMRLFFILALLLLTAPGVSRLINGELQNQEKKRLLFTAVAAIILLTIIMLVMLRKSTLFSTVQQTGQSGMRGFLKNMIESVTFADTVVLGALIQLCFLAAFLLLRKKINGSFKWTALFWSLNLIILAQPVLPASFVSKVSPREINAVIHASPAGYPASLTTQSLAENSKDAFTNFDISGLGYFYNKKPGISKVTNSPAFLAQADQFIQTEKLYAYVSGKPLVYIADIVRPVKDSVILSPGDSCNYALINQQIVQYPCGNQHSAVVQAMSSNSFTIETVTTDNAYLVLTQNYYPFWQAAVDGKETPIIKTNISFMGVRLTPGKHTISFKFVPGTIRATLYFQLSFFVLLILTGIIVTLRKNKRLS